jgi:DNA-binding IscR family transcriptional regulator
LSNKSQYGLKALLVLAHEAERGPILVADLAAQEGLLRKFLKTI